MMFLKSTEEFKHPSIRTVLFHYKRGGAAGEIFEEISQLFEIVEIDFSVHDEISVD